jgi:hypothetical protein
MAFYRKSGEQNVRTITAKTATAVAKGDLVKTDGNNNQVDAAASNGQILGIAITAKAGAVAGTVDVDILRPGDWIVGSVETGTPAVGDWDTCDLNSADGVTLASTNEDFIYQYNGTTDTVDLLVKMTEVVKNT